MKPPRRLRASTDRLLGSPAATALGFLLGRSLRVLAFHGILDPTGFKEQMEWLVDRCTPVSASRVVGALSGAPLPAGAVWVTFDDGHPSVVEQGLPVLLSLGIPATMFICPGVVDTDKPFWWQVIERGIELDVGFDQRPLTPAEVTRAKLLPDDVRRRMVEQVQVTIAEITGSRFTTSQLSTAHLERWIRAGNSIGNHTWDHPMLDRCTQLEQRRQVALAHEWIIERLAPDQLLFAYPNGNWTRDAEAVLREFGYHAATLFNHRLSDLVDPFKLSRLRTNADGDLSRFRATVSGTHPFLSRLLRRT